MDSWTAGLIAISLIGSFALFLGFLALHRVKREVRKNGS